MKRRILAVALTVALVLSMSMTVCAGSSSKKSGSSSSVATATVTKSNPATVGTVNTNSVSVGGTNLTSYTNQVNAKVAAVVAGGSDISTCLSAPASAALTQTIKALGGNIQLVNRGGYAVQNVTPDGTGKNIASVGVTNGISQFAKVVLVAVNTDGTTEIVEGVVDPVSGRVMGAFAGTPKTITVNVIMAK